MAFPAIQGRRRRPAAYAPPGARLKSPGGAGVVTGLPLALLCSEGVALLALAIVLYGSSGRSWWLFVALLPAPDVACSATCGACAPVRWPTT
jgi:hypothetical protein